MLKLVFHAECYADLHSVLLKEQEIWLYLDFVNRDVQIHHAADDSNSLCLARNWFSSDNINTVHFSFQIPRLNHLIVLLTTYQTAAGRISTTDTPQTHDVDDCILAII